MKRRQVNTILSTTALILSLGLVACQSPSTQVQPKIHHYTLNQKCPSLLDLKVGEILHFQASENPSTGYQWKLVQPLKLFKTEESFQQQETEEGMLGAGGEKSYHFQALKPGQEMIELIHVRAWETSQLPEQQWQCRIRVS